MNPIARKRGARVFFQQAAEGLGLTMAPGPAVGPPLDARVNHGRWLVHCPDCAGAELVDPEEPFFFCLSCGNEGSGGRVRRVRFPAGRELIEGALGGRRRENQNWAPGETIAFLVEENARGGER